MSATTIDAALAGVYARAGASDEDREAWLAERAQGVTATELAKIMISGSREQAIADLVRQKREGDSFTGNAYTEWGKEREPVIAESLAGFGLVPESRVFHAEGNSGYLASPDGITLDFDGDLVLDEIKTSGVLLYKGSPALAAKGYEWQMQWCCFVIGATGCYLNVEQRLGQPGAFVPGDRTREWFPRDETMIAQLIEVADQVLAAMADEGEPVIDEAVDTHAVNYLRARDEEKKWGELKKASYKALIDAGISQESPLARVTITPAKPGGERLDVVVDLDAAAEAHPKETAQLERAKKRVVKLQEAWDDLANAFKKETKVTTKGTAARAKVTPGKGYADIELFENNNDEEGVQA